MNKFLTLVCLLFIGIIFQAKSQLLNDQCESMSPCNARPICSNPIVTTFSFTTSSPNNPIGTCASSTGTFAFNSNWVYYRFTCASSGILNFRLIPNDSITGYDLDWAIWDITTTGCGVLNTANVIECNAAGPGATGIKTGGIPSANFEPSLNLTNGNTYIIGISNPTGSNTNGFTLDFTGTTANIFDTKRPYMQSITPYNPCLPQSSIQINLSEPVRCDQLLGANDFVFSLPTPSFYQDPSPTCPGCVNPSPNSAKHYGNMSKTVNINFASPLAPGTYTVSTVANAFFDICGYSDSITPTLTFTVGGLIGIDVHTGFNCTTMKYIDTVFATNTSSTYQFKAVGGGLSASFGVYGPPVSTYTIYTVTGGIPVTYTVKDILGCEADVTINHPSYLPLTAPNLSVSSSPPCHDQFNQDSITVQPYFSGASPYTFVLSPSYSGTVYTNPTSNTAVWKNIIFPGLGVTFTVTVTDAWGCSKTGVKNLINPTLLSISSLTSTNPICFGDSSGVLCVGTVTGGTPPPPLYSLSIQPIYPGVTFTSSPNCFHNLPAGIYTITASDGNGCSVSSTKLLSQPAIITFFNSPSNSIQPSCSNLCNGSYTPILTGGSGLKKVYKYPYIGPGPYTYADSVVVSTGPNNKFNNLCAGTYTLIAVDALGCTKTHILTLSASNPVVNTSTSVTACGSYTIGSNTYTSSTNITQTYTSAFGCDSIHTTSITINPLPIVTSTNVSGCAGSPIALVGSPSGGVFSVANPYTGSSSTYYYSYTDANGCVGVSPTSTITVSPCMVSLNLKIFIEGYYIGSSLMTPAIYNQNAVTVNNLTDILTLELHQATLPYTLVDIKTAFVNTQGNLSCSFNASPGSYYLAVKSRNALETWSASPISLSSTAANYNFTNLDTKAYGGNMKQVEPGVWAIYSGEINFDQNIDLMDMNDLANDVVNFVDGYVATDLNGDSNVDLSDLFIITDNVNNFIYTFMP